MKCLLDGEAYAQAAGLDHLHHFAGAVADGGRGVVARVARYIKAVVVCLKRIYQSATAEEAAAELDALEAEWGEKYRAVVRLWRGNWDNIIPFFQFLPEIRKVIYTTNAIESLNMVMRKYTRNRRIFPNDDAALKAMFLAVREASRNWKSIHHWKPALASFQVMFGDDRVPLGAL